MRPLRRNTTDTRAADLTKRVESLERRIYERGLPWAMMQCHTGQAVTVDAHLEWDNFSTNDTSFFGWDDTDPSGLIIKQTGLHQLVAEVAYPSADISDIRAIYQMWNFESAGLVFSDELRPGIGTGQRSSSIAEVNASPATIGKSRLSHFAIAHAFPEATDPYVTRVVLQHSGTNYSVSTTERSYQVVWWVGHLRTFFAGTP